MKLDLRQMDRYGPAMLEDIFHAPLRALQAWKRAIRVGNEARARLRTAGLCETCGNDRPLPQGDECKECYLLGRAP